MEKYMEFVVEWVVAAVKAQPYVWCATTLTFLIGVQLALAASIAHGDEATVRRQLTSLKRIDIDKSQQSKAKGQLTTVSPVASCAPAAIDTDAHPNAQTTYNNCYMIALQTPDMDSQGYTIWKSLTQQDKPDLSKVKTEIWIPKPNADENDPLVQSGGCVIMSFPDPSIPGWLNVVAGYLGNSVATPQVACILPLEPTKEELEEHKIKMRPFKIDGEDGKGLDMETLPAVSDILSRLKLFLGVKDKQGIPQGITVFKRA
ncbi:molybdopterin cofactor [Fusarium sporotrichioides]|uniref:Molybdopterin cofactor n=1 Tax=Fusarium sporotrichioides TaxID=5514 RepID=A0A395SBQ2_FUSSP|nr:molybdopterin cofactor [Fusarium sporotrichioides]